MEEGEPKTLLTKESAEWRGLSPEQESIPQEQINEAVLMVNSRRDLETANPAAPWTYRIAVDSKILAGILSGTMRCRDAGLAAA